MYTSNSHFAPAGPGTAQLGNNHGYAFDGDQVSLYAEIRVLDPMAASSLRWVPQLWAGDTLVASADCGTLQTDAFGIAQVQATVDALLPAGTEEHALTLALACDDGSGLRRCDSASYPRSERFNLPRLDGSVSYALATDHTVISVDGISNPRAADNLSGSLVLELWALPEPYRGGAFSGILIGSDYVGELAGQAQWTQLSARLPACELPAGRWHLTLMLREWVGNNYLTRDYRGFSLTVDGPLPAPPTVVTAAPAPAEFETAATECASLASADTPVVAAGEAVEAVEAIEPVASSPAVEAAQPKAAPRKSAKNAKSGKSSKTGQVSINQSGLSELSWLRGINDHLAAAIIAGRPWKAVDDLLEVKGIGPKLLEKLRPQVRL